MSRLAVAGVALLVCSSLLLGGEARELLHESVTHVGPESWPAVVIPPKGVSVPRRYLTEVELVEPGKGLPIGLMPVCYWVQLRVTANVDSELQLAELVKGTVLPGAVVEAELTADDITVSGDLALALAPGTSVPQQCDASTATTREVDFIVKATEFQVVAEVFKFIASGELAKELAEAGECVWGVQTPEPSVDIFASCDAEVDPSASDSDDSSSEAVQDFDALVSLFKP